MHLALLLSLAALSAAQSDSASEAAVRRTVEQHYFAAHATGRRRDSTIVADAINTHATSPQRRRPCMSLRDALARCVTGWVGRERFVTAEKFRLSSAAGLKTFYLRDRLQHRGNVAR